MTNKPPAFQFYPEEYLGSLDVRMMTREQELAYLRLLIHQGDSADCKLPDDHDKLAFMARMTPEEWKTKGAPVCLKFVSEGGKFYNKKLLEQRKEMERFRKAKKEAGRQGGIRSGLARKQKGSTPSHSLEAKRTPPSPSLFPSPSPKEQQTGQTKVSEKINSDSSVFLANQYRQYISKSISAEKCQTEFSDALKRGLDAGALNASIEAQWNAGMKVWDWMKAFEKEHRQREAKPKIFRASDETEQKPLPPEIKKILAEATQKLKLHPEKPNADQPKPDEKPC